MTKWDNFTAENQSSNPSYGNSSWKPYDHNGQNNYGGLPQDFGFNESNSSQSEQIKVPLSTAFPLMVTPIQKKVIGVFLGLFAFVYICVHMFHYPSSIGAAGLYTKIGGDVCFFLCGIWVGFLGLLSLWNYYRARQIEKAQRVGNFDKFDLFDVRLCRTGKVCTYAQRPNEYRENAHEEAFQFSFCERGSRYYFHCWNCIYWKFSGTRWS